MWICGFTHRPISYLGSRPWEHGANRRRYLPDKLEQRFRMEVAKRYGVKKGNMLKAISEAIEAWVSTDESRKLARTLAKPIRDPSASVSVKQHAVTALASTGVAGRELLADIGADPKIPDSVREQAFKAISAQSDR